MPNELKVGLIEGRHLMPVDCYLLTQREVDAVGYHEALYAIAYKRMERLLIDRSVTRVELYATGLTNAVLGAFAACDDAGAYIAIASFDRESGEYVVFNSGAVRHSKCPNCNY